MAGLEMGETLQIYMEMCEEAEEIQSQRDFSRAGHVLGHHFGRDGNQYFGKSIAHNAMKAIWLPLWHDLCPLSGLSWWDFVAKSYKIRRSSMYSKEIAGLRVVMWRSHKKVWDHESGRWEEK